MVVERSDTNNNTATEQQTGGLQQGAGDPASADAGVQVPAGTDPTAAAKANKTGEVLVNGWTGQDDVGSQNNTWTVAPGSASANVTVAAASTATTTTTPATVAGWPSRSPTGRRSTGWLRAPPALSVAR